jgi:hypothetical protein
MVVENVICASRHETEGAADVLWVVVEHAPEAKRTLNRLRHEHISAGCRIGGDDASIRAALEDFDRVLGIIARARKSQLPDLRRQLKAMRSHRSNRRIL